MLNLEHFFHSRGRHNFGRDRGGPGFGGPGFGGPAEHFGRRWGGRTRRGEGKFLVLEALLGGPKHGYEIMGTIEAKRGARPSAGSIYPTLQMLEDGGFVTGAEADGKRVYTLTDAGRELLTSRTPDSDEDDDGELQSARQRAKASALKLMAAMASARASDDASLDKIREVIDRARREIYAILAADET